MKKSNQENGNLKRGLFARLGFRKATPKNQNIFEEELVMSPTRLALNHFKHDKMAMTALVTFILVFVACMILPFFYPLDVRYTNSVTQNFPPTRSFLNLPQAMRHNPKKIAVGAGFSAGIDEQGKFHLWGYRRPGLEKLPKGITKAKFVDVAAGADHIVALDDKGKIWTMGNTEFNLGEVPEQAEFEKPVKLYANYLYSIFVSESGEGFKWGNEFTVSVDPDLASGELDHVFTNSDTAFALTSKGEIIPLTNSRFPTAQVPEALQGQFVTAAATSSRVYAVTKDGKLHSWGNPENPSDVPIPEGLEGRIKELAAGSAHVLALLDDGSVVGWGDNNQGQLSNLPSGHFERLYAGFSNAYAIDKNGDVVGIGPKGFLMGTDELGRDIFRRIILGGRMTMTVGAIAVLISALIGIIIGGISGFYSGKVDVFLMRFAEVVNSIPFLPLAMILSTLLARSLTETQRIILIMFILGILGWPSMARLTRAQILSQRKREFVTAAQALGVKESKIIFKHIVPNVINVLLVSITLGFATSMLTESSLSFLGFGVQPPQPTWGNMLNGAQSSQVIGTFWWRWVFPSLFLAISTISINSLGDGLRDAIDPKSQGR